MNSNAYESVGGELIPTAANKDDRSYVERLRRLRRKDEPVPTCGHSSRARNGISSFESVAKT